MKMSRQLTADEMRASVLGHLRVMVDYWDGLDKPSREKLGGLVHSILVMLDGGSVGLPAFDVVPAPHPDDKQYCQDEDTNWWPDDVSLHDGGHMLHELWSTMK